MKKIREGLSQYLLRENICNGYFREVEYEMIHQNKLDIFLGMQLRQKDDIFSLLYDVTGMQSISSYTEKKELRLEDCREFLQLLWKVFQTVDEFLLEMKHINFSKDGIYRSKEGSYKLLYCPDCDYDVEKDIEELFAWMLSRLDYRDHAGVRLIYRVYDTIRNQGFSQKAIEYVLVKTSEYENDIKEEPISPESNIQEESISSWQEDIQEKDEPMLTGESPLWKKILLGAGLVCSLGLMSYWIYQILQAGFSMHLIQYLFGSICMLAFFSIVLGSKFKEKEKLQ